VSTSESTDVLVIGSGFGGAIAAYHLAAGGARVTVLERGPWLTADTFDHDFHLGSSSTRIFDFTVGDGMSVLGGNCVGGGSVVYFAAMPRAPKYVFDRHGSIGRRIWPASVSRSRWTRGTTGSRSRCRSTSSRGTTCRTRVACSVPRATTPAAPRTPCRPPWTPASAPTATG
jgi:choline dehydrogenase-like flavoprotein